MRLNRLYFQRLLKLISFLLIGGTLHLNADTPPGFQNKSNISKSYWLKTIDRSQEFPDLLIWQKTFKKMYDCLKKKKIEAIAKEILDSQKIAIVKILPL